MYLTPPNSIVLKNIIQRLKMLFACFFLFQYTTEDLLDQIQASEEELMTQLQVLNACEIEGSITCHCY